MSVNTWHPAGHNDWCSVNLTPDRFALQVNSPATEELDFHSACDYNAQTLYKDWGNRPLYLGLSGGVDSELIADVFVRNQIPFVPFILKIQNINDLESWYAEHWCWRNQMKPVIYHMTMQEFEQDCLPLLAKISNTHQTGIIIPLWMANHVASQDGYLITGVGELNWDLHQQTFYSNTVDYVLNLFDAGKHPSGFFSYTPEFVLSYIKQFDIALNEQYNKVKFYQVPARPKFNWTSELCSFSTKTRIVISAFIKKFANSQRHEFGDQQTTIKLLKGTS
jgi:hypothetical protein